MLFHELWNICSLNIGFNDLECIIGSGNVDMTAEEGEYGTKMVTCLNLCLKILNQSSTYISRYHPKNHHTITLERLIRCSAITHCNNSELVRVRDTPGSLRNREQSESYCVLRKRKEKWEITCKCGFDAVTEKFVKIGSWLRPPINHLQERQLQV